MNYKVTQQDYYRHSGKWVKFPLWKGGMAPGYRFSYCLRKAQQHDGNPLGLLYKLLLRRYSIRYGFQISYKTEIGEGLYLGHWGAVVINPKTKIGKNCNLAQGVTIGQTNRGEKQGVPVLGDEVWIGANAVLVGGISIGNNVLIAPNAYVNIDVPDDSIVMGNPAVVKSSKSATKGYINNKV